MSKLQAALAKIRTSATPAASLADKLHLPAQQESDDSSLPTDAGAIKNWLIVQNAVNSTASRSNYVTDAETLLKTLQHSNRTACTPSERMQIMEVYERPFIKVMQSLDLRYLYLDFPLQADAQSAFQLAATLCQEMAFGYKFAVADSLKDQAKDGLFAVKNQKANRSRRCIAIRSANKYLTYLALRHSQVNRDWPAELWQDLNALINIAIQDRTNNVTNKSATSIDQMLTIEEQFASLCALTILDQNQLAAEEVRALFLKLCANTNLITFHSTAEAVDQHASVEQHEAHSWPTGGPDGWQGIYTAGNDGPPVLSEDGLQKPGDNLMYFSLHALLAKLHVDDDTVVTHDLSAGCKRRESRAPQSVAISAETGLQDIHTRILLTPPTENATSQFTDLKHLLSDTSGSYVSRQAAMIQTNLLNQTDTKECSGYFEVENESPGGFGLMWTGDGACRVQVGELLGHCYQQSAETSWHISVVRWLRTDADGILRLGVESLSRHTQAVSIKRLMKAQQSTVSIVEGLLINYQPIDSEAEMLILPKQNYKAGETIAYRDDKDIQIVQLVEGVEISGQYQCFAISKVEEELLPESAVVSEQYRIAV